MLFRKWVYLWRKQQNAMAYIVDIGGTLKERPKER